MKQSSVKLGLSALTVYSLNTVVVGSGAAGWNAIDRLFEYGQKDIALVTEHILAGTSRNTGSDKQTYYKLTLSGGEPDSVHDMAQTLFSGQCVDGDIALCEAALSPQSFLRLVELGVPFPKNRYGEYIGYKTDHDPRRRATSIGPYTSKKMTECLQASAEKKGVQVFNRMQVVRVLTDEDAAVGLLCLDLAASQESAPVFVLFNCKNIVYATGGPAGMYWDSVYPQGHYGASGLAFEAGVLGKNLTEWQYGLASVRPRWNVSGTYMQALPRVYSTDAQGEDERDFLSDFFERKEELLSNLFMKGYQWPFDVVKVEGGSSMIDILVFIESSKGRRVYLDYRKNAGDEPIDFDSLSKEASDYLRRAGAFQKTPIERLSHMNRPAVDFYLDKGVDLSKDPLEIALCAQHNNGGLGIDCWWQSNLPGFFAAGEVCASHGVVRPGGSALNAGQVGSTRAAQYIAARRGGDAMDEALFSLKAEKQVAEILELAGSLRSEEENVMPLWESASTRMSRAGAAIRCPDDIKLALLKTQEELASFKKTVKINSLRGLSMAMRLRDMLMSQEVYLSAMADYQEQGGKSRGSALYTDPQGTKPDERLPEMFRYILDGGRHGKVIQEAKRLPDKIVCSWRDVRPIPSDDDFFENVWRTYRENGNIE